MKTPSNLELKDLLDNVAAAYKITDPAKNKFRIVAYERAATAVEHLSSEAKDLWDEGKLTEVSGIGESIAGHLDELFRTGRSKHFDEVMKGIPPATFELLKVSGIGPKTAYKLATEYKVPAKNALAYVEKLAKSGKIAKLEGFGEGSQKEIIAGIEEAKVRIHKKRRLLLPYASEIAHEVIEWVKKAGGVIEINPLGSLRRRASTVGDIDIAVATESPKEVLTHFTKYPKVTRVLELGDRSASVMLPGSIQVDLMAESPAGYGALLQHFTGSKQHNIALRNIALKKGFSLSDWGVRKVGFQENLEPAKRKYTQFKSEEELYKYFGLAYIPPELREDMGEFEAAKVGELPKLVEVRDIKADLQIHSSFDIETSHDVGQSSFVEVLERAGELGYEYVAFTEHNPSKSMHTKAQIVDILKRKREAIDTLNAKRGTRPFAFNSLEIDILPNGSLPVPEEGLATLDFALASLHSSFKQSKDMMTKRVLTAFAHPKIKVFAHPTARKLEEREGVELDWPQIFEYFKAYDKWIEINADPARLDLPDFLVREAVRCGLLLTLGTDSHARQMLDNMPWGVTVARRGWATKADIVNTRSLAEFEKLLG